MDQNRMDNSELTERQAQFVVEYVIDLNGAQAAIRAGYSAKGARNVANRLLANSHIRDAIGKLKEARGERLQVTADRVVQELARIAFANIKDVARWNAGSVQPIDSEELDDEISPAVSEVSETTKSGRDGVNTTIRVKMHDKLKALGMLAQHLGMMRGVDPEEDKFKSMPIGDLITFVTSKLQIKEAVNDKAAARPAIQQPMHARGGPEHEDSGIGIPKGEGSPAD